MNQQPQSNRRGHFWSIILALIIGLIGTAWGLYNQKNAQPQEPPLPQAGEGLTVYFLPAGEGQCVLVTCDGKTLLLDGGDGSFGQDAADFLRSRKVQRIDLLVSSRPDEAYSGGLAAIVQNFPVKTVLASEEPTGALAEALGAAGKTAAVPEDGETFSLGSAEVTVRVTELNVILPEFSYGETHCILGGVLDRADAIAPRTPDDVTVWVSDGERLVCLTAAD